MIYMVWYDIWYMIWYDMIWYYMIWYGMIWYDIWYGMIWYMIWYDDTFVNCNWVATRRQLYNTHLHTNSTKNDTKILEECGPCPDLASYTLAFALQLRKEHGKTSVRWRTSNLAPSKHHRLFIIPEFYVILRFFAASKTARHLSDTIYLSSVLILLSYLRLDLPNILFPSTFLVKFTYFHRLLPHTLTVSRSFIRVEDESCTSSSWSVLPVLTSSLLCLHVLPSTL